MDSYEIKVSLVYIVRSRTAKISQRNPVSKNQKEEEEEEEEEQEEEEEKEEENGALFKVK